LRDELETIKAEGQADLRGKKTTLKVTVDAKVPSKIMSSSEAFKQIVWNLVQTIAHNCNVTIECSIRSENQLVVEIQSDKNGSIKQLSEEIQQICLAEEIGAILKSVFADHSLKVALVLARYHGWPIDYVF
jgi:hypothetical protein